MMWGIGTVQKGEWEGTEGNVKESGLELRSKAKGGRLPVHFRGMLRKTFGFEDCLC